MIRIRYTDDLGDVEASFDSLDEFYKFKEIREARARESEKKAEEKERLRRKELESQWYEIKNGFRSVMDRAHSFGMSPSVVVHILNDALIAGATGGCMGDCSEGCRGRRSSNEIGPEETDWSEDPE